MKKLRFFTVSILILFSISCQNDNLPIEENPPKLFSVNGYVQKGPYLNGTSIIVSELKDDLAPTGKNFSTQILDNKGTFEIKNIELTSEIVELKASGFYFDEVRNQNSAAQLTLFALSDLNDNNNTNVNILSSLEKSRLNYLVSNGSSFTEAKKQAQKEILAIFEIEKDEIANSELLDISEAGEDNAILLAISVIMQGYLSVSDLSELLANMSTDIREDGMLNSASLGTVLINNAHTIKLQEIRKNLETRYKNLGLQVEIPDFEKYVNEFIGKTDFEYTGGIKYPETGMYGINILDKNRTEYSTGTYSMKAILPEGSKLNVKIKGQYHWMYRAFQTGTGWRVSDWNDTDASRVFTALQTGEIDFEMKLQHHDGVDGFGQSYKNQVEIFVYENEDVEPTWTKTVHIK